jgi:hypothetical protein
MPVRPEEIKRLLKTTEARIGQDRQYLQTLQHHIRDAQHSIEQAEQTYLEALEILRQFEGMRS